MGLSANSVFEVRVGGSDTNGGGFVTGSGGTDYSQQNGKNTAGSNISTTDAVGNGTTTITSATAAFTSAITGNIIYLSGGSGSLAAGWYQATYVSSTSITVDRSVASGTGITMNIGGALLSPAVATNIAGSNGQIIFVQYSATPFSITSVSFNVAAGCLQPSNGSGIYIIGYNTNRTVLNTDALRPTLKAGIASASMVKLGLGSVMCNFILDGNSGTYTGCVGVIVQATGSFLYNCSGQNFTSGFVNGVSHVVKCTATLCGTTAPFTSTGTTIFQCCEAYANTVQGFNVSGVTVCVDCLAYNNTGGSSAGFYAATRNNTFLNCVAYGNGSHGFDAQNVMSFFEGCIAENNAGWGFANGGWTPVIRNCSTYNNTLGAIQTETNPLVTNNKTPAASVFVNPGSLNFGNASGAVTRGAQADLNTFTNASTTGYADIGIQHQDSGGGSIIPGDMEGGCNG